MFLTLVLPKLPVIPTFTHLLSASIFAAFFSNFLLRGTSYPFTILFASAKSAGKKNGIAAMMM